ncbi:MAG: hypothetical protein KatS3mg093_384 [Candidatus Parcubacteria bacterium]|nr:MAG: hypothetical protein KatS3mg093_384 [Candidatus Parcubacteria bacterium]
MIKIFIKQKFYVITILFFIAFYFSQVLFLNKTLLTHNSDKILEGSEGYNGFLPKEITVIDPAGSAWIDVPLSKVTAEKIKSFKLPLWNQYSGAGKPLAANQTSNAFSLIRYLLPVNIFPTSFVWDMYLIFRIFLLSVFSFLYLRLIGISRIVSLTFSLALGFSGHIMLYSNLFHLDVEVILPLLFIGIELLFKEDRLKRYSKIVLPIAVLLTLTGGNIQSSIINLSSGVVYFTIKLIFLNRQKKIIKNLIFSFLSSYFLGIGLSLFYLLPFIEFYLNSFHVHSKFTGLQGFSIKTLPSLIFPFIYGPIHSQWSGYSQHLLPSYLGITPFFIFLVLFFLHFRELLKNKTFLALFLIFVLFFLKIFNFSIVKYIAYLPILNRIIFTKYLFPFYFSFYSMVAISFNLFFFSSKKKINKILVIIIFGIFNLLLLYGLYEVIRFENDLATKYIKLNYIFKHIIFLYVVFFGSFVYILAFYNKKNYNKIIICALILIEFFISSNLLIKKKLNRYDSFANPASYVKFLIKETDDFERKPFRIFGVDRILISQISAGFKLEDLRDLDALVVKDHWKFMREFITGYDTKDYAFFTGGQNILNYKTIKFLSSANVRFLLDYTKNPNLFVQKWLKDGLIHKIYSDSDITIYEINNYRPRVFFPKKVILTNDDVVKVMKNVNFNPNDTIVIKSDRNKIIDNTGCFSNVKILKYEGDDIFLNVKNKCNDAYLFVSNVFYPGWTAYIGKEKTSIEKANLAFQAIKIPRGEFVVRIVYLPSSFYYGLIASVIILLILIISGYLPVIV